MLVGQLILKSTRILQFVFSFTNWGYLAELTNVNKKEETKLIECAIGSQMSSS